MSKNYYRVFFLSNSQLSDDVFLSWGDVKELLSCFLFKQFTTLILELRMLSMMSKNYYRVFFLSNSQQLSWFNVNPLDVKELLSCFLFKQFSNL